MLKGAFRAWREAEQTAGESPGLWDKSIASEPLNSARQTNGGWGGQGWGNGVGARRVVCNGRSTNFYF